MRINIFSYPMHALFILMCSVTAALSYSNHASEASPNTTGLCFVNEPSIPLCHRAGLMGADCGSYSCPHVIFQNDTITRVIAVSPPAGQQDFVDYWCICYV